MAKFSILFTSLLSISMLGAGSSWAIDHTVNLKQVSSSGKTLLLDRGLSQGIKEGDHGILLAPDRAQQGELGERLVYLPVAKLKALKVASGSSLWVSYRTFLPERLKRGSKLMLLAESELLSGRRDLVVQRKTVTAHKDSIAQSLKDELSGADSSLVEKADEYERARVLSRPQETYEADIQLVDLDVWEKDEFSEGLRAEGFYKSPQAEEFSQRMRVERFEKMAAAFLRKRNDPKFTDDRAQKRYEQFKAKGGEGWSDDYDDRDLAELLYSVGAVHERQRREEVGTQLHNWQVLAGASLNLLDNENMGDNQNTRGTKYDVELGLEWHPFKSLESLRAFSLAISARRSVDSFSTGVYNALGTEYSGAFHVNWHPFASAHALEKNIFFVGLLWRYGTAAYKIPSLGESADYTVASFPGLRAGLKYNFRNGLGAYASLGYENNVAKRSGVAEETGELPDSVNHLEGKLSIGLSRFF